MSCISTADMWNSPATTGQKPTPCEGITFTAVDDNRAVMFGGGNGKHGLMNDVHILFFPTMV